MFQINSPILKLILIFIVFCVFILFLIPFTLKIINMGNIFGASFSFSALLFLIFNKQISNVLLNMSSNFIIKVFIYLLAICLGLCFLLSIVLSTSMLHAAYFKKPDNDIKVAILLGSQIKGNKPSIMLSKRISSAYDFLEKNKNSKIIVSGGQGENEDISEAQCMKETLVKKGIDPNRIIMEDKSTNTEENIKFSKEYILKFNTNDIVIISDAFHQLRAHKIAEKENLNPYSYSTNTQFWLLPTYWVREWFGLMEQMILR